MSDEARRQLADKLRESREYLGLSQEEVARELGIARPAISQIERGNRRVDALELATFARLYQRAIGFFTGEEPTEEPQQFALLKRAATELSEQDRAEVLRFAEFLRNRTEPGKPR